MATTAGAYGEVPEEELEDLFLDYGAAGGESTAAGGEAAIAPETTQKTAAPEPPAASAVEARPAADLLEEPVRSAPAPAPTPTPTPDGEPDEDEDEEDDDDDEDDDEDEEDGEEDEEDDDEEDDDEEEIEALDEDEVEAEEPIAPAAAPQVVAAGDEGIAPNGKRAVAAAHVPPPPPPHAPEHRVATDHEPPTPLTDNHEFRQQAQRLARGREWQRLAAITTAAIDHATWVALPETRAALLLDLARIHRDRLSDPAGAEVAFRRLAELDPTSEEALQFLSRAYRDRGDWRAVYDLYSAAIEPTWDPHQRLAWTRETAEIAATRLRSPDLAIEAWERLDRLGDAAEESYDALSEMYRRAGRWQRLAEFLAKRATSLEGTERTVALREVAEAYLSGLRDAANAGDVLEELLARRPDDVIALLAYARVLERKGDWGGLAQLGERALDGVARQAVLDLRRAVAGVLWQAGESDLAMGAYERVIELDADDAEALSVKEQYLTQAGRHQPLVNFLVERAERQRGDEARAALLGRAADLAEKKLDDPRLAASLWQRRAALPVGQLEAHQALERLYEALGDLDGMARSLEGQLALTRRPAARVDLLRRLGEHSAHRLGDDAAAERCWKEILSVVPADKATHAELLSLHRRRGDFESLDRALGSLAWRSPDAADALELWRTAARNVDDNLADPRRGIAAWHRVLDLQPNDAAALRAHVTHQRALGRTLGKVRPLIAALEAELRVTTDGEVRVARALEVARLWEEDGQRVAALAAFERVLRWDPINATALAGLARMHAGAGAGAAVAAFEVAAAVRGARGEQADRVALVRQAIELAGDGDKLGRFYGLRRVLWLSERGAEVLDEVARAAAEAGAFAELAAVYEALAAETPDAATRGAHRRTLAKLYEERLDNPARAYLVLQAARLGAELDDGALAELARLADATGRHEDLLAALDAAAGAEVPTDTRRAMVRRRAEVCETKLKDPARAFAECARLLSLDPRDERALADARRLAGEKSLWRALDALYAELADRAEDDAERIALAQLRHDVRGDKLGDAAGALDQLTFAYRLDPAQQGLADRLLSDADAGEAWDRVLPVVEARVRALGESASPDELDRLAGLHENQREDLDRAFELYAEAFVLRPDARGVEEDLGRIANKTGRHDELATVYRAAAARATATTRKLELYRKITTLGGDASGATEGALDAHRQILQLEPAALPSLEVMIERHRSASEWRDLRDRLEQWTDHAPESEHAGRVSRWLEIAHISRDQLGDAEAALGAYARILDVDPTHGEALEGVRSLAEKADNPRFELRRLRIELARADKARRAEVQLACARIERVQLDDAEAAMVTLRALIEESGADGPGFEPLAALLRERQAWRELVELTEARAGKLADAAGRAATIAEAVRLAEEHPEAASGEHRERLYRRLLDERPDDLETRRRLLGLLRSAGQHEELAALLRASIAAPGLDANERVRYQWELARVLGGALGRTAEAEQALGALAGDAARFDSGALLLARAHFAKKRGDFGAWLEARLAQARHLPPPLAAMNLCALAEACDETQGQQLRVAGLYREARTLDPQNPSAMEALKAIGRRAKSWRGSAALLADPDEALLSPAERAARLCARGDEAQKSDVAAAADYYLRAVAIDPDHYLAWDALGALRASTGDAAAALDAHAASLGAWERAEAPAPDRLVEHAARIHRVALATAAAGDEARAATLSLAAHRLAPGYAAAAIAVADGQLAAGDTAAALARYDRVLADKTHPLSAEDRLHATWRRGQLAWRLGKRDQGLADLQAALRLDPLHGGALMGLAEAESETGRVALAAQHYIQALLVEHDVHGRGTLYARLGLLWEDKLDNTEEAGVCYDHAISAGVGATMRGGEVPDLLKRALGHYRRQGRPERALAVIERILPTTEEPRELAALWGERGAILAQSGDEERAMEAYDMALSYDPGSRGAITGLSQILERRGDWEQLAQIFEARTETGSADERAEALRALARMSAMHLKDLDRTERYLRQVVQLAPTKEDFEQLLVIYGDKPQYAAARLEVLPGLLGLGGPFMPRLIDFGRMLVGRGDRRWAWCVLSPLMNSTLSDPPLKQLVLELRKEFEKSDNTAVLTPKTHLEVRPAGVDEALLGVLGELDDKVVLGRATLEEAGAIGTGRLDERTAVGKTFAGVAARLGLEGTLLTRAQELPEPYMILDGPADQRHVLVRAELLQLLSIAETGFLFTTVLEEARPGLRVWAALPEAERPLLVPALLAAVGLAEVPTGGARLVEKIVAGTDEALRAAWAARLAAGSGTPSERADRLWRAVHDAARRVGLIAAADLRFAARVITRLDDALPKMQTVGRIDDLDEFIANAEPVRSLLGFSVTPLFGKLLHGQG